MPQASELIIGLSEIKILKAREEQNQTFVEAIFSGKKHCEACGSENIRLKDRYQRNLKHTRIGTRIIHVLLTVFKQLCLDCGKTTMTRVPGILPRRRSSENFRLEVFEAHHDGHTQKKISKTHGIGQATVERWYSSFIDYRVRELSGRAAPRILGIDEHFFTRKQGYATTLVDLRNRKVFDVILGRSERSLASSLSRLPERNQVQVVVMDMAETYRSIARKYFPNALIVTDRFHVVRLVQHHFLKLWKQLDPEGSKSRGLLSLMRQHRERMKPKSREKLERYLDEIPGLRAIDEAQQKLLSLMRLKRLSPPQMKPLITEFLEVKQTLELSGFPPLETLAKTLHSWRHEILRMWRFSRTNAATEGFHNKMETISRRSFGFRNFSNYRKRVIALCGWDGIWNRVQTVCPT
ncbi:MAG: ISL3 family transposase [Bradymonadales bacterium]|nr:MAG: ISL3 family transposase [Bradymonadales bacterium]